MSENYVTTKEMSKKWGITLRRIQIMCSQGRIPGAKKVGRTWMIPEDAKRPIDGRVTTGEYRNWRKKRDVT